MTERNPTSQKAKLIARLQTYVPLYDWPLLDELAESNGPDRDAVLEEAALCAESCDVFSSDAIEVSERIRALKNAAPQAGPSAGNHSGEDFRPAGAAPEGSWRCPTCSATCIPKGGQSAGAEPQWTPTYQGDNIWTGAVPPCWLLVNDVLHPENEPWVTYWDGQGYPLQSNHYRVIGYYRTPLPPTKRSATPD